MLQPLNPNIHITKMDFTHTEFWVQAHGLPFGKLTKSFAAEIALKVGTLTDVDCDVDGFQLDRSFLHFKVKINFKYERLGDFCYNCGRLGHDVDSCGFECDSAISHIEVGLRTSRFISPPSSQHGYIPSQDTTTQPHTPPSSSGNSSKL
uniref:Zinc finger, CCHC-type n=1 Tax=Tanacetum cinerariifolium TaxID=118510 RepID=A0A699HQW8_TANCI|nr:zinc finger, CCHC-type [Tanacetum cinerariifolium]